MTLSYVKMKSSRNIIFESATGPRLMRNISSDGPLVIDMLNGFNLNFQFLLKQGIRRNFFSKKKELPTIDMVLTMLSSVEPN